MIAKRSPRHGTRTRLNQLLSGNISDSQYITYMTKRYESSKVSNRSGYLRDSPRDLLTKERGNDRRPEGNYFDSNRRLCFDLVFTGPPTILVRPQSQQVKAGGIASFYCTAEGAPPPQIHWRKNGKRVSQSQSRYLVHNYENGALLRIEPVRPIRDNTLYECLAENGVGDAVSAEAQLRVYEGKWEGSNLFSERNRNPDQRSLNGFVDRTYTYIHPCTYASQPASQRASRGGNFASASSRSCAHRRHRRTAINVTALANGVVEI
ncbi:hypothetical protein E2986_09682 [Frieseomelitta varia]|uniref:Ig-like domain-containing protein n=1 Tax=Frieseomelitta varia TaxID=561572 RepID=A0A833W9U7_9HYME|nr:hypothetical protein E2986_09682 [Frieseomelitta varia]